MNKEKKKKALAGGIIVLGAVFALINMVLGVRSYAAGSYTDLESLRIILLPHLKEQTDVFYLSGPQIVSVWLKMPDRKIEQQDIEVTVYLNTEEGALYTTQKVDFLRKFIRYSSGKEQYYKIGDYQIAEPFRGRIHYEIRGRWTTSRPAELAVRRQEASSVPFENKLGFLGGVLVLGAGAWLLSYKEEKA